MAMFVDAGKSRLDYTVVSLNNRNVTVDCNATTEANQVEFDKRMSTAYGSTFFSAGGEKVTFANREATLKKLENHWRFISGVVLPDSISNSDAFDFKVAGNIANTLTRLQWCKTNSVRICRWMSLLLDEWGYLQAVKNFILEMDRVLAPIITGVNRVEEKLEIMVARYNQGPSHPHASSPAILTNVLKGPIKHHLACLEKEANFIRQGEHNHPLETKLLYERYFKSILRLTEWALLFRTLYKMNPHIVVTIQEFICVINRSRINNAPPVPKLHPGWSSLPEELVQNIDKLCDTSAADMVQDNLKLPSALPANDGIPAGMDKEKWGLLNDIERDAFAQDQLKELRVGAKGE
jgi:hypothetical protein